MRTLALLTAVFGFVLLTFTENPAANSNLPVDTCVRTEHAVAGIPSCESLQLAMIQKPAVQSAEVPAITTSSSESQNLVDNQTRSFIWYLVAALIGFVGLAAGRSF